MRPRGDDDGSTTTTPSSASTTSSSTITAGHATEAPATQAQRKHATFVACAAVVLDTSRPGPDRLPTGRVSTGPPARHGKKMEGRATALVRAHGHAARNPGLPGSLLSASPGHSRRRQRRLVAETQQGPATPSAKTQRCDAAVEESVLTAAAQWPARYTQVHRKRRFLARLTQKQRKCWGCFCFSYKSQVSLQDCRSASLGSCSFTEQRVGDCTGEKLVCVQRMKQGHYLSCKLRWGATCDAAALELPVSCEQETADGLAVCQR